jgi:hypothetical protein
MKKELAGIDYCVFRKRLLGIERGVLNPFIDDINYVVDPRDDHEESCSPDALELADAQHREFLPDVRGPHAQEHEYGCDKNNGASQTLKKSPVRSRISDVSRPSTPTRMRFPARCWNRYLFHGKRLTERMYVQRRLSSFYSRSDFSFAGSRRIALYCIGLSAPLGGNK